jgi:aspartate ammonia-lyase
VLARKLLTREQLDQILQPEVLTQPRAFAVTSVAGQPQVEHVAPKEIG